MFYGCGGTYDRNQFDDVEECEEVCKPSYLERKFPSLFPPVVIPTKENGGEYYDDDDE